MDDQALTGQQEALRRPGVKGYASSPVQSLDEAGIMIRRRPQPGAGR